jgi:hypothetical protein
LEQAFEGTLVEPLGNGRPDLLQRIKPYSAIGLNPEDRDHPPRLGERFGRRPSDFLKGEMSDLLVDLLAATELSREDARRWRALSR